MFKSFIVRLSLVVAVFASLVVFVAPTTAQAASGPLPVCRDNVSFSNISILQGGYISSTINVGFDFSMVAHGYRDAGNASNINYILTFAAETSSGVAYLQTFNDEDSNVTITGITYVSYLENSDGSCS